MRQFVITVALALPGLFDGGTVFAGCGCGCRSGTCSQPAFSSGQPAFGPGSYRVWNRQDNCWLYYDAATKGTYFWSPVERRYQLIPGAVTTAPGGVPTVPSSDGHQHQHGSTATTPSGGPAHCPNCVAQSAAVPGDLPAMPAPIAISPAAPGGTDEGHQDHQHDHAAAPDGSVGPPELLPSPQRATAPYGGQKLCPVTGDELGSMGAPIPVTVRGRTIWLCCRGCVTKVQRDPDKYLRKVEAERAGQQPKRP